MLLSYAARYGRGELSSRHLLLNDFVYFAVIKEMFQMPQISIRREGIG